MWHINDEPESTKWHRHNRKQNHRGIRVPQLQQQQHARHLLSLLISWAIVFTVSRRGNGLCEAFLHPSHSFASISRRTITRHLPRFTDFTIIMPPPTQLLAAASTEPMQVEEEEGSEGSSEAVVAAGDGRDPQIKASETSPPIMVAVEANTHDELMYALGVNLARQLGDVRPLVESSEELTHVAKGLLDTVIGRVSEEFQRELLLRRGKELNALITDRANTIRERLERSGRQMLKEMSERDGTQTLESGVVLHVLEAGPEGFGHGVRPTKASTVKIHYHGTLPDGTVFDSTLNGDPVVFPLAQVIPGWRDGVLKMHEGETAMLGIPPEQAYGAEGTPDGRVPGGSTLFFKVQLLEVLTAGIGGSPNLLGADGKKITNKASGNNSGSGLLGPDGRPVS